MYLRRRQSITAFHVTPAWSSVADKVTPRPLQRIRVEARRSDVPHDARQLFCAQLLRWVGRGDEDEAVDSALLVARAGARLLGDESIERIVGRHRYLTLTQPLRLHRAMEAEGHSCVLA